MWRDYSEKFPNMGKEIVNQVLEAQSISFYLSDKEFKDSCLLQFKVDGIGSANMKLDPFCQWNGKVLE